MTLDVIVPTYKRAGLLRKAIASLHAAHLPAGMQLTILAVDNNSEDDTESVIAAFPRQPDRELLYVRATRQGLSHARNAGIAAGTSEVIAFIDDDEEVAPDWLDVIDREFRDPATKFIGGPYLGNWSTPEPDWLPPGYHAAIGVIPPKPRSIFGGEFTANLMGGNAIIRREVFEQVGGYSAKLGRSGKGLLSEEDAEFCRRLEAASIRGVYVPDLLIHHYIAPERLTRSYHRRWAFWRAVSQGVLDRELREPVPYLLGMPRHRFGRAMRSLAEYLPQRLRQGRSGEAFARELALWDLAGFAYGKHLIRIDSFYKDSAAK